MKRCGLGLIGYGGVARALVSVIDAKRAELNATHGVDLIVTGVSDIHGGCVTDPRGVDLAVLKTLPRTAGALEALPGGRSKDDNRAVVSLPETDIVVEATVTNPETGEPALSYCREALSRGKHLVTTNKGPVAFALGELLTLAQRNGREIGFEGTVMSGTPLLRLAADNLAGCKILSFRGILNGTANYVLGQMESGATMEDAVRQAQALGFAEADPTADLEGFDVLMKVVILSSVLFGAEETQAVRPHIHRAGISDLSEAAVRSALSDGGRWKLIGEGRMSEEGRPTLTVGPQLLPADDPLADVSGAANAVTFETDLLGEITIVGPGAGREETAFALLSDILAIHRKQAVEPSPRLEGASC